MHDSATRNNYWNKTAEANSKCHLSNEAIWNNKVNEVCYEVCYACP